jgi:hypothetical protein
LIQIYHQRIKVFFTNKKIVNFSLINWIKIIRLIYSIIVFLLFQRVGPSSRRGPEFCPRFMALEGGGGDLFISSGNRRKIAVQAVNLHDQMAEFKCQYTLVDPTGEQQRGTTHEKLAQKQGDQIM